MPSTIWGLGSAGFEPARYPPSNHTRSYPDQVANLWPVASRLGYLRLATTNFATTPQALSGLEPPIGLSYAQRTRPTEALPTAHRAFVPSSGFSSGEKEDGTPGVMYVTSINSPSGLKEKILLKHLILSFRMMISSFHRSDKIINFRCIFFLAVSITIPPVYKPLISKTVIQPFIMCLSHVLLSHGFLYLSTNIFLISIYY